MTLCETDDVPERLVTTEYQPSTKDQILFFNTIDLQWTSPESGATLVQIIGLKKTD